MNDALAGLVIGIGEKHIPVLWKSFGVHSKPMILRGDVTAVRSFMNARLVMPTITVPETSKEEFSSFYKMRFFRQNKRTHLDQDMLNVQNRKDCGLLSHLALSTSKQSKYPRTLRKTQQLLAGPE